MIIESFLSALTSADKDGRIVVTRNGRRTPPCSISVQCEVES